MKHPLVLPVFDVRRPMLMMLVMRMLLSLVMRVVVGVPAVPLSSF
jgi:hypothetical protein